MADHPLQEDQTNRQDGGSQSTELVDRLARRSSDPIGVIDVRYAEQKYARILGWLADRFGLIDQLRHRYDADEGLAGNWQTMVMQRSSVEHMNLFSTSIQSLFPVSEAQPLDSNRTPLSPQAASSLAGIPPQSVTSHLMRPVDELTSTSEPKYRISRRRSVPPSSAVTSSTSSETEPHAQVDQVTHPVRIPRAIEVPPGISTQPPFVFAKPLTESVEQSLDIPRAIEVPPGSSTPPPFVFAKRITESAEQSHTDTAPRRFEPQEGSPDAWPRSATAGEVPTQITTPSARSSQRTEVAALQDSIPLAPAAKQAGRIAVAAEVSDVRNAALSRAIPDIVWRNNRDAEQMTYLASGERGSSVTSTVNQAGNAAGSAFAQQTNEPAASDNPRPNQFQKDEIRIEQLSPQVIRTISERVMRAISLDLKVERERRGVSKWR